jgi:hypothetical protein
MMCACDEAFGTRFLSHQGAAAASRRFPHPSFADAAGWPQEMARRQPCTRKVKAARSPLCEAGGTRRRAPAGAEGAQRGAPVGASA